MNWCFFLSCMAATVMQAGAADTYTIETTYVLEEDATSDIVLSRLDSSAAVTFKYSTIDQTATSGNDFTAVTESDVTFPAGSSTVTLSLTIADDGVSDPGERFSIRLTDFSDGTKAKTYRNIYIVDSEDIDLHCRNYFALENKEELEIKLRRDLADRTRPITFTVSAYDHVTYGTTDVPSGLDSYEDKAENGKDFLEFTKTVTMAENEMVAVVTVDLIDDVFDEKKEPFIITVTGDHIMNCKVLGVINNDDLPDAFHCKRTGQECQNGGTCNENNGVCSCPPTFRLNDCSIGTGAVSGCDRRCGAGGFCQIDGDGEVFCVCRPGFAGDFCNYTAYNTECHQNHFGLCVTPFGDFQGAIFIDGSKDVPGCNFIKVDENVKEKDPKRIDGVQNWCEGYFLKLDYDGSSNGDECGVTKTVEGSNTTYIAKTIVQYTPEMINSLDEIFTSFCRLDADNVILASETVEVDADTKYLKKQVGEGEAAVIDFSLKVIGSGPIDNEIYIDDKIKICADIRSADAWDCVRLKQVDLHNDRSGSDYQEATIYNEGCYPSAYESAIINKAEWDGGDDELSCMTIMPFRFDTDFDQEKFTMVIIVYADLPKAASCSPFTCGERRKRQATEEEEVSYTMVVNVNKRADQTGQNEASDTQTVQESEESDMMPAIIGATVGGTLLVMSIIVIACRRRTKDPLEM